MKIEIVVKRPDVLEESIKEAVHDTLILEGVSDDELESIKKQRVAQYKEMASKWWEYDEYVTLVFDTDAQTMTVKEL